MTDNSAIQTLPPGTEPGFANEGTFVLLQRAARLLSSSTLVPAQYRAMTEKKEFGKVVGWNENPNAVANCVIALNIARRMRADELMVMQNLYVVEGRPSWSSQWVIAAINTCGNYSKLRFDITDLGPKDVEYTVISWEDNKKRTTPVKTTIQNLQCIAWAIERETGERVESPPVTMEMAIAEGWYQKNGSKWQTMPQVMLRYRAAAFFGKLYAPELLMGLPTDDESRDIQDENERVVTGREIPAAPTTSTAQAGMAAMLAGRRQEPESRPETAPEPEPASAKPAARARAPRKAPAEEPPAPAVQANAVEDETLSLLDEMGYQRPEFIGAVRHLQISPARNLSEINAAEWAECLRQWELVRETMDTQRGYAGGQEAA